MAKLDTFESQWRVKCSERSHPRSGQLVPQDADPQRFEARKWWVGAGKVKVFPSTGGDFLCPKIVYCSEVGAVYTPCLENLRLMIFSFLGVPKIFQRKNLTSQRASARNITSCWDPRRLRRAGFTLINLEVEKSKMPGETTWSQLRFARWDWLQDVESGSFPLKSMMFNDVYVADVIMLILLLFILLYRF